MANCTVTKHIVNTVYGIAASILVYWYICDADIAYLKLYYKYTHQPKTEEVNIYRIPLYPCIRSTHH